jgi:hypothetical protein
MSSKPMRYHLYQGRAYRGESGLWSWVITMDDQAIEHGHGFDSESQADEALAFALLQRGLDL